jgi:uncharacterized YccA/Bax inhibitor family protein
MSNPTLNRLPYFSDKGGPVQQAQYGYQGSAVGGATPDQLAAMYGAPTATPIQTGRMTYDDVLVKTTGMFGVLIVSAAIGWVVTPSVPYLWVGLAFVGLALALINIFKREPSPVLVVAYGVVEGFVVGALSMYYNAYWDGIVLQAVLASLAVFGVTLALFASGKVRASRRASKVWLIAMLGYLVFSLINLVLMATGAVTDPWGLRGQLEIFGIPLGIVLGVVVVIMAAYSFVTDFDLAQRGVRAGAPAKYAWSVAFSILLTMVWLYLEMLRLLAILRNN